VLFNAGEHFQWSDTVKGQVSSSFFLGYTVTNFVGALIRTFIVSPSPHACVCVLSLCVSAAQWSGFSMCISLQLPVPRSLPGFDFDSFPAVMHAVLHLLDALQSNECAHT
jgi:hypothetical protein